MTETIFEHAVMGQYLKTYQPPRISLNRALNAAYGFRISPAVLQRAIVTEKKYPDVSFWQGDIHWPTMRSQTDTLVIREGQNEWTDPRFPVNWRSAKDFGMYRAAYRFYDGRVSPGRQAENMVRNLENDLPEMEFVMDWERSFGGPYEGLRNVVACMQRVSQLLPGIPWKFYTGYFWFTSNSNAVLNASQYAYLKEIRLWEAWYTDNFDTVRVPLPWVRFDDLQYGTPAEGEKYGADTVEIDMNAFHGTTQQFYERYGGIIPEPPDTGEPMPTDKHMKVTDAVTQSLNIRTSGEVLSNPSNDLGAFNLLRGDIIHVIESKPNNYQRFDKLYRGGILTALPVSSTGQYWSISQDSGGVYLVDTAFTPPPTEPPVSTLPASWEVTQVAKDEAGEILATYKGTLTKQ